MFALRWSCSHVARFGLIALAALVWSAQPVEAQQQCGPPGRSGGGGGGAGGAGGAQLSGTGGAGLNSIGRGTSLCLAQEFFAEQQRRAASLQGARTGRAAPMLLDVRRTSSRKAAARSHRARRRSDRESTARRRQIALQLSRERQLKEANKVDEAEAEPTPEVAPDPDPVPAIFAVQPPATSSETEVATNK